MSFYETQIGWNNVPHRKNDDISCNEVFGGNLAHNALAEDSRSLRLAFFQGIKSERCSALLYDADDDIHEKRREYHERVRIVANEYRPEGGTEKNENDGTCKLPPDAGKERIARRFRQAIFPECEALRGFFFRQSEHNVRVHMMRRLLDRPRMPVSVIHFPPSIAHGILFPLLTAYHSPPTAHHVIMAIHESIKQAIPEALRAKDEVRLRTLRSLSAAMTNEIVAKKRKPYWLLTDEEAIAVLKRAGNQRKDSIEHFNKAGRTDLSAIEKEELIIIESLLPSLMSREEIEKVARVKMAKLNVSSKQNAGKFIGAVMKELKGKADGGDVKAVVDTLLQ